MTDRSEPDLLRLVRVRTLIVVRAAVVPVDGRHRRLRRVATLCGEGARIGRALAGALARGRAVLTAGTTLRMLRTLRAAEAGRCRIPAGLPA